MHCKGNCCVHLLHINPSRSPSHQSYAINISEVTANDNIGSMKHEYNMQLDSSKSSGKVDHFLVPISNDINLSFAVIS